MTINFHRHKFEFELYLYNFFYMIKKSQLLLKKKCKYLTKKIEDIQFFR